MARRKQIGKGSGDLDVAHERLLLAAMSALPPHLARYLQGAEPLNAAIEDRASGIRKEIDRLLVSDKLPKSTKSLLHDVPLVRFVAPNLAEPTIACGTPLYQRVDHHGEYKRLPELLEVVDLTLSVIVPTWWFPHLRSEHELLEAPPAHPADALKYCYQEKEYRILVSVFPANTSLNRIVRALAALQHASVLARAQAFHQQPPEPEPVIAVVDRLDLFDALATSWNVVLLHKDEPVVVNSALEGLDTLHKVRPR